MEKNADRNKLADEADRPVGSRYIYSPQEFQTDFRFTDVIKDTVEYNLYTRDNTLLEMDYVFEIKDSNGTILGLYGYSNHILYEMDSEDRWQEV